MPFLNEGRNLLIEEIGKEYGTCFSCRNRSAVETQTFTGVFKRYDKKFFLKIVSGYNDYPG